MAICFMLLYFFNIPSQMFFPKCHIIILMTISSKCFSHHVAIFLLGTEVCPFLPYFQCISWSFSTAPRVRSTFGVWKMWVPRPHPNCMNQNLWVWSLATRMPLNVPQWLCGRGRVENHCSHNIIRDCSRHLTSKLAGSQAVLLRKGSRATGPLEDKQHVWASSCLTHCRKGTWNYW